MKIHYAKSYIFNIVCGINAFSIQPHYITFNKRKVTCKNCHKTKAFRKQK